MAHLDNPAGRLRAALETFGSFNPKDTTISEMVCTLTGTDHTTLQGRAEAMHMGSQLARQCVELRAEAELLPEFLGADIPIRSLGEIENALDYFTLARQQQVGKMLERISSGGHQALEMLDRHLHLHRPQPVLDDPVTQRLTAKIQDLRKHVREADDLDEQTREFIDRRFGDIEQALADATLDGFGPVEVSIESIMGSFRRQPSVWQRVAESSVANIIGGTIVALFMTLSSPPTGNALPPGTPEEIVFNYTVVVEKHAAGEHITVEQIDSVFPPRDPTPKADDGPPALEPGQD